MRIGLLAIPLALIAAVSPAQAKEQPVPILEDLVASTDACTGKVSSDAKMRAIWTASGWKGTATAQAGAGAMMSFYTRKNVNLNYFTSSIMRTCAVWAVIPDAYDLDALVTAMATKLNKPPRIEEPGKRIYYRNYRGLKILNLLVKTDERGRYVELSVVH